MDNRMEWTAPTLETLDVKETFGGIVPGFNESDTFTQDGKPDVVVRGVNS